MKNLKQLIALALSFILLLGTALPIHAEESLTDRIRELVGDKKPVSEPEHEASEETGGEAGQESAAEAFSSQQNEDDDDPGSFPEEVLTVRAAFSPEIMIAAKGTQVFSDSRLTALLGTMKNNGIIYALSLSGDNAVRIALVSGSKVYEGYVSRNALSVLSDRDKATYEMIAFDGTLVYGKRLIAVSFAEADDSSPIIPVPAATATPKPTATPKVTATPKATATPKPTATPKATATPKPTATPKATATPKPTATPKATAVPDLDGYPEISTQSTLVYDKGSGLVVVYVKASSVSSFRWQHSVDGGSTWSDLSNSEIWNGISKATMYFQYSAKYDGFMFRCRLTNSVGTLYSDPVALNRSGSQVSKPEILEQPANVSVQLNGTVFFSVRVKGAASYQWEYERNGSWTALSDNGIWNGSTTAALSFQVTGAQYAMYRYRCKVSNSGGYVYSQPATLTLIETATPTAKPTATPTPQRTATPTVKPTAAKTATPAMTRPSFTLHPQSQTVSAGSQVTLTVSASNAAAYQWQYSTNQSSWVNLPANGAWAGTQSDSLSFTAAESYQGYYFRAVASNSAGAVLSNSAKLTVTASRQVSISAQPQNVSAAVGEKARFSVQAENASSYQWYYLAASSSAWKALTNGSAWSGTNTAELSFTVCSSHNGGQFRCVVSDSSASVTSSAAVLSLAGGTPVFDPGIETTVKAAVGSSVTLTAKVSGASFCQWQVKLFGSMWTDMQNSSKEFSLTEPSLTLRLSRSDFGYQFRVKASNAYGTAYSPEISLVEAMGGPSNVTAAAASRSALNVSWTASRDARTRFYRVYYNTSSSVNTGLYVDVNGTGTQLTGLNAGTTYHVWVQAVGDQDTSIMDASVHASAATYAPAVKPGAPSSVTASASATSMTVSWKKPANSEVDGYYVYYALTSSNSARKVSVSGGDTLSAALTGLSRSTSYQIWVSAYNEAGEGAASTRITATTLQKAAAPAQPTNVQAVSAGASSVKVTWTLSSSADAAGYYVYYGTSSSANDAARYSTVYSANTSSATVTGLTAGRAYYFWVAAFNSDGAQSGLNAGVMSSATPKAVPTSNKINAVTFSMMGDKYLYTPYSTYDCQAFVERMLADAGDGTNLAGSNAWYRKMSWRGTPEQCKATFGCIPTGAFLFIVVHDGGEPSHYNDNLGNANHIGVVIHRNGGAIHSSQRKGGVYYSVFNDATIPNGGWNMIGLWTRMDYGDEVNEKLEALTGK